MAKPRSKSNQNHKKHNDNNNKNVINKKTATFNFSLTDFMKNVPIKCKN